MRRHLLSKKLLLVAFAFAVAVLATPWILSRATRADDSNAVVVQGVTAQVLDDAHIVLEQPSGEDRAHVTTTADDARQLAVAWTTYPQEVDDVVLARYQQLEEHCLCWVVSLDSGSPPRKFSGGPARPEGIPSPTPRTATGWLTFYLVELSPASSSRLCSTPPTSGPEPTSQPRQPSPGHARHTAGASASA